LGHVIDEGTAKYALQKFPALLNPKYCLGDEMKQRKVSTIRSSMLGRGTRVYDFGIYGTLGINILS